jgi:alkaline phosphatase
MRESEWLRHGPASLNQLLERQSERDKLADYRAGIIASVWIKDATPGTFFPALKAEEDRQRKLNQMEQVKAKIKNARKRKLEDKRTKGTE